MKVKLRLSLKHELTKQGEPSQTTIKVRALSVKVALFAGEFIKLLDSSSSMWLYAHC